MDSNNNNPRLKHSIDKGKAHRLNDYTKKILDQSSTGNTSNKKPLYSHSDDDDEAEDEDEDDEHHGSISDCDVSGNCHRFHVDSSTNLSLISFQMDVYPNQVTKHRMMI